MKVMKTLSLLMVISAIIFSGCGFLTSSEDARNLAEKFLNYRFETGGVGDGQYYSDLFWKYTPQKEWNYITDLVETHLGDLQSYTLKNWQVKKGVNMGDLSGTFVVLIYNTEYEYGSGQEKITLMKGFWDRDFQIIGHHFESPYFS
ncbi:MAG: hypothetical protein JRF29_06080 [Deltaproteobacteria bacterium]|jgi:hypothetical protein|nr:hypothetical protein [Deltaproteobacteria bacterium]